MDDAIGDLLELLDEYKIADDTIVIFFSDNGGGGGADNSPLQGGKTKLFEGGIRVPCIIRYPHRIQPGSANDTFLTSLEIVPTILSAANIDPPTGLQLDGYDMMTVLSGEAPSPRKEMFWQRRDDKAARVGNWKWVDSSHGGGLFDLAKDIGEQQDLSQQHPEKLRAIKKRFAKWQNEMAQADPRGPFRDY